MVREVHCYHLEYKLQELPEVGNDTFIVSIPVIADTYGSARRIAEKWLETDGHKSYRYTQWVGCIAKPSEWVLFETDD